MSEELETCPKCGKDKLRPTGKTGAIGEFQEPFRETSKMRVYACDSCGFSKPKADAHEYIPSSDSVDAKVIKDSERKELKKDGICSSCHDQKPIVFHNNDKMLCRECLDSLDL